MDRGLPSLLLTLVLGACAVTPPIPMYDDIGIRLSGVLSGALVKRSGCFAIRRDTMDPVILVLPRGSRLHDHGFTLPDRNGGKSFYAGEHITVQGGYMGIPDRTEGEFLNSRCNGEAFFVNHAEN